MGEWGGWVDDEHDKTGENRHWLQEIRDYMIDKHIHHTFWCFNENSSDTGGLVYDNFQKWDDVKYEFVKPALWQDGNGKFISLDHTIPLGTAGNGISLSDYYGGGNTTPQTTTTTKPVETTTTTIKPVETTTTSTDSKTTVPNDIVYGDANCDGEISLADAVLILQYVANPDKFGIDGSDKNHMTKAGKENADCNLSRDGITSADALSVQKYLIKLGTLPVE